MNRNEQYTEDNHKRYPAVPLVTHDPYFSLWSSSDKLYDSHVVNWTGREQKLEGTALIDDKQYRFMGLVNNEPAMEQTGFNLSATSSVYTFCAGGIELEVSFTSPLLPDDLDILSRPVTYLSFKVRPTDGRPHTVALNVIMDETHCRTGNIPEEMSVRELSLDNIKTISLGKAKQTPLNHSGDEITIDWGYLYMAVNKNGNSSLYAENLKSDRISRVGAGILFENIAVEMSDFILLAYDDTASIVYFGEMLKGYWSRGGKTILEIMEKAAEDYSDTLSRCALLDVEIAKSACETVSASYAEILALAYRQSVAAHKLIADGKNRPVFLSKECHSNGCIGTVDVSYPSIPLYLLLNPELVRAMMRPVLSFASKPVWEFDYAPHDVGRYPYANGQVYALKKAENPCDGEGRSTLNTIPPIFTYPAGTDIYDRRMQMPVEECGNMLIMAAAALKADGDFSFAEKHKGLFTQWADYLVKHGSDPGNQLCTDDFAGHLARNVNLAAKAIMGIASFSILLDSWGEGEKAVKYREKAEAMASDWEKQAFAAGEHTALAFDSPATWGQKYNLIWDLVLNTELFSPEVFERETAWYLRKQNRYGLPLDNRAKYTKSDWILWCASFAERRNDRAELIEPLYRFIRETPDRVPFSDWYDTDTARSRGFQNRTVQGGLFMPLLRERHRPFNS